jgi:hypothetical protein
MAKKSPSEQTADVVERMRATPQPRLTSFVNPHRNPFGRWPTARLTAALEVNKRALQELKKADPNWRLWGTGQPRPIEQQAMHLQAEIEAMELERVRQSTNPSRRATLESASIQPSVVPPFEHSEDFRTVEFGGKSYNLTPRQAQVVQFLFEEREKRMPEVAKDRILETLGSPNSRLRDTFKNSGLWGTLILPGMRRGTYRLNLKPHR